MSHFTMNTKEQVVEQSITLLDHIFPSPRSFTIRLWNQEEIPAELDSTFVLVLKHPGTLRRMFTPPIELALGEAYIYQDFDLENRSQLNAWLMRRPVSGITAPLCWISARAGVKH